MGAHAKGYKVNIKYVGEKSQEEITAAYTDFYVGVVSRVLKSSTLPLDKKNEILDALIKNTVKSQSIQSSCIKLIHPSVKFSMTEL